MELRKVRLGRYDTSDDQGTRNAPKERVVTIVMGADVKKREMMRGHRYATGTEIDQTTETFLNVGE